jgi:NADH dehydrogenase
MLLVDFRSRIVVYVNWSWAFFTYGRGARLLTGVARLKRPQSLHYPPSD